MYATRGEANTEFRWTPIEDVTVAARSATILLIEQDGADLALQISNGGKGLSEQDGPDQAFGTEVAVLENSSDKPAIFQIRASRMFRGVESRFHSTRIVSPTADELDAARALSQVSRKWLAGAQVDEVLPFVLDALKHESNATLHSIAVNAQIDVLMSGGRSADAIPLLRTAIASSSGPIERVYRRMNLAAALWESLQTDEALKVVESLRADMMSDPEWRSELPNPGRRWLEVQVNTVLGAVRIFAGRAHSNRRLMDEGGKVLETTLASLDDFPELALRARLTEYLANYYMLVLDRSGRLHTEMYREAATLYEQAGDRVNLASIRNNEAYAELGRGNIESALRLYLETLELQQVSRQMEGKAHVRARIGYLYFTLGDYRRAEIRYRESIEMYRQLKLPLKLVHIQLEFAELLRAAGRTGEALDLLNEIRSAHPENMSPEDQLRLATETAAIHLDQSAVGQAERALTELGDLHRFDNDRWQSLQSSIRLFFLLDFEIVRARIEMANRDSQAAQRRIERGLAWLGDGSREPLQQLQLLYLQMRIAGDSGQEDLFDKLGRRALGIVESVRGSIDYQTQGPAWSARTGFINSLLVSHSLSRYLKSGRLRDLDRAVEQLESVRARNLRDARSRQESRAEDAAEAKTHREMQSANQALLRALLLDETAGSIEQRLAKAEERYQFASKPRQAVTAPRILGLTQIRERLASDTQARVFFAGKDGSFMLVLAREFVRVVPLPTETELKRAVAAVAQEMRLGQSDFRETRRLADLLFPTNKEIPTPAHLLIESDGIFSAVPFSVLVDMRAQPSTRPSITRVPSLSELYAGRQKSDPAARKSIALVFDPAGEGSVSNGNDGSGDALRETFGPLPFTRVEAKSILDYYVGENAASFEGKTATVDTVTGQIARNARVLHIATHGFASEVDPLLVGLALANRSNDSNSGLLTLDHIGSTRYRNELVVVSACDSARGQLLNGEGLMSISRAFLASGAKATLSTLWPVPDRANAEFMKSFYFALTQMKNDSADALVYAQQTIKGNRRYSHPYYWGAYELQVIDGSFQPIDRRTDSSRSVATESPRHSQPTPIAAAR